MIFKEYFHYNQNPQNHISIRGYLCNVHFEEKVQDNDENSNVFSSKVVFMEDVNLYVSRNIGNSFSDLD